MPLQAQALPSARLQDLHLSLEFVPAFRFSSATAAALAGLHTLRLDVEGTDAPDEPTLDSQLAMVGPLHTMTKLRDLHLHGEPLHLAPRLRLPPNLTRLHLGGGLERPLERLPEQVGQGYRLGWFA